MSTIPRKSAYRISKHFEVKPGEGHLLDIKGHLKGKPIRKWMALAAGADDLQGFDNILENGYADEKKNTVLVENIVSRSQDKNELLAILLEHVQCNMVKIGKKFFRQKEGIPQGSVLSSLLCNYFYADLEARHLSFLRSADSLLLRLIDDFLLITTDRAQAKGFLQIMHDGLPEYGVTVNPEKTLVNFEAFVNGRKLARLVASRKFPYCGTFIDTKTLDISKDRERRKDMGERSQFFRLSTLTNYESNCGFSHCGILQIAWEDIYSQGPE